MFQLMPGTVCGIAAPQRESEKCKLIMKQKKKPKKKRKTSIAYLLHLKRIKHTLQNAGVSVF